MNKVYRHVLEIHLGHGNDIGNVIFTVFLIYLFFFLMYICSLTFNLKCHEIVRLSIILRFIHTCIQSTLSKTTVQFR